mgnify:CR=1 FL=1
MQYDETLLLAAEHREAPGVPGSTARTDLSGAPSPDPLPGLTQVPPGPRGLLVTGQREDGVTAEVSHSQPRPSGQGLVRLAGAVAGECLVSSHAPKVPRLPYTTQI